MEKLFRVQLKPGHPTGTYRRDGVEFTSHSVTKIIPTPLVLNEDQVTEGMRGDPWLEITPIEEGEEESPPPLAA
jgi:hypothetical protein